MAFRTSEEIFQSIFGSGKKNKTLADEFFLELVKYLDNVSDQYQEAGKLSSWIRNGNEMLCFHCRADLVEDMSDRFKDDAIPFITVMDPAGHVVYMIRSCDAESADAIRDAILEAKAKYCTITTGEELKKKIAETKDKDKDILYIGGLSPEEADVLREYCEEELDNNDIGIDEMEDGTYTFSFIGKKALRTQPGQEKNLAYVTLRAMLAIHGPNRLNVERMARNRASLENAVGRRFRKQGVNLNRTPAWVVGRDNQYIKVDETGFEYGRAVLNKGDVELREEFTADVSMPDYDAQLNSYLTRMRDGTYTYDVNEAYQHFLDPSSSTLVVQTTRDDRILKKMEQDLATAIHEVVTRKNANDHVMQTSERWNEKFDRSLQVAASLMTGIIYPDKSREGEEIRVTGFSREDVAHVTDVLQNYDVGMGYYEEAADRLHSLDTYIDRPTFTRFSRDDLEDRLQTRTEDGRDERRPAGRDPRGLSTREK